MIGTIDNYAPCFCGSGKKYRFCCMAHMRDLAPNDLIPRDSQQPDSIKAYKLLDDGLMLMHENNFRKADDCFQQLLAFEPMRGTAYNNLVACAYAEGKPAEALAMIRKQIAETNVQNPFGLALMAELLYMNGQDKAARNAILIAANQDSQTPYSVEKICDVMARLKLHRELIAFADGCDLELGETEEALAFFSGVAAANLGNTERAIDELSYISLRSPHAQLAQSHLALLEKGKQIESIRGEWIYFTPASYIVSPVEEENKDSFWAFVQNSQWLVDMVEAVLLDEQKTHDQDTLQTLAYCKHPSAEKFLRQIINWSRASDELRLEAGSLLISRGDFTAKQVMRLLQEPDESGKSSLSQFLSFKVNPNLTYGGDLPEECEELNNRLLMETQNKNADNNFLLDGWNQLIQQAPDFYPFQYNRACILLSTDKIDEADYTFRSIAQEHPEYVFAHAMILNILIAKNNLDEAQEYIDNLVLPDEIHPDAAIMFFCIAAHVYILKENFEEAQRYMDVAKYIDPESEQYKVTEKIFKKCQEFFKAVEALKNLRDNLD